MGTRRSSSSSSSSSSIMSLNDMVTNLDNEILLKNTDKQVLLVTDTVGLIHRLPSSIQSCFAITLDELIDVDIVVNVIDISNSSWKKYNAAVLDHLCRNG